MGALYHLKQKLVDFCNVIQENVSRTDTVPSSKVVYDLKADSDSQISDLNDSLTNVSNTLSNVFAGTFTPSQSGVDNALLVRQNNRTVTIYGYIGGYNFSSTSEQNLGRISGVSYPANAFRTTCEYANNGYTKGTTCYLAIDPDGYIRFTPSATGTNKYIYFTACWVV